MSFYFFQCVRCQFLRVFLVVETIVHAREYEGVSPSWTLALLSYCVLVWVSLVVFEMFCFTSFGDRYTRETVVFREVPVTAK